MKLSTLLCLLIGGLIAAPLSAALAPVDGSLSEAELYSLYVKRHDMTIEFARLALAHGADKAVRAAAEDLAGAHSEARQKLERVARDRHLMLAPPEHDISTILLEQARGTLEGKEGRSFDTAWVGLAHTWLSNLILDNNRTVKAHIAAELQPVAQEHTSWLFHQSAHIDKLLKKFK